MKKPFLRLLMKLYIVTLLKRNIFDDLQIQENSYVHNNIPYVFYAFAQWVVKQLAPDPS